MKAQFKLASNLKARFIAIYGEEEQKLGVINLKDQESGEQITIKKEKLYNKIITELMNPSGKCTSCEEESCDSCE